MIAITAAPTSTVQSQSLGVIGVGRPRLLAPTVPWPSQRRLLGRPGLSGVVVDSTPLSGDPF